MIRCSNFKPILMFYIVAKITDYQYCFCGWYTRCRIFVVESWITSVLGSVNILLLWLWETTILGINIKRPTVLMWYICQIIADNFVDDCHVLEYMWFIRKKRPRWRKCTTSQTLKNNDSPILNSHQRFWCPIYAE